MSSSTLQQKLFQNQYNKINATEIVSEIVSKSIQHCFKINTEIVSKSMFQNQYNRNCFENE